MTDYEVTFKVKVTDIRPETYHFHYDTMDFIIESGIINNAEIVGIKEIDR